MEPGLPDLDVARVRRWCQRRVTGAALREAITDGWLACAPPRLAPDFLAG